MTVQELDVIRELYHVPDYVEFRLLELSNEPTRPFPSCIALYQDYFLKRLKLPLQPFLREALLNLDISLPQLNSNAVQSLVAVWVFYWISHFLDLTVEEF